MFQLAKFAAAVAIAATVWAGLSLTAQEPKPGAGAKGAPDVKGVNLTALKDAVVTAEDRGANVDEISKALAAFEKAKPTAQAGRVPPELQALRDAVDAAARKGENVDAVAKELLAVEMAVAGKSLAKPRPDPRPDPVRPNPRPDRVRPLPFPEVPFPALPANPGGIGGLPGGIDIEKFNKSMELRGKALDLMIEGQNDPAKQKEAQKLLAEANDMMLKAAGGLGGFGRGGAGDLAPLLAFPELARVPDRARLGIRLEAVPAVAAEQLGLDPNTGITVTMVMPGTPAEKAGLKAHDIVLEFAGKPVTGNTEDFIRRVNEVKAGAKIDIVVLRKGKKVEVKGVELPETAKRARPQLDLPVPNLLPAQPNLRPALPLLP